VGLQKVAEQADHGESLVRRSAEGAKATLM
jgi:hypothetical protein